MLTYTVKARAGAKRCTVGQFTAQSPLGALLQAGKALAAAGRADVTCLSAAPAAPARLRPAAPRPAPR